MGSNGGWVDTEVRRSYALADSGNRLVDDKGTEGKELAKRKASGDENPYGNVELCLSFRPGDMNAAALHLHEQKQHEEQQQAQSEQSASLQLIQGSSS